MTKICLIGAGSERDREIRKLNRTFEFRRAVSQALDRVALGQSLVRGPLTHPHPGWLYPETVWFNAESSVFYPYAPETSKALLAELGFQDTDGNGIVNWTSGPLAGQDLEVSLAYGTGSSEAPNMADSIVTMLREVGIKVIPRPVPDVRPAAQPWWHRATAEHPRDLLPFENELVELIQQFRTETDSQKAVELMHRFNKVFTENIYHIGLITAPGALIINKRVRNASNPPILAYDWAEDAAIRERFWTPTDQRVGWASGCPRGPSSSLEGMRISSYVSSA